jgi:hypothetical protein
MLPVRHDAENPLASVADVRRLGNTGGGDLDDLLVFFAEGNHARMRGPSGRLDTPVPPGLFSLELPGSQGSHPGHSGVLQGDPGQLSSGRFSQAEFARLAARSKGGLLTRSAVGLFIAENLHRNPRAKVSEAKVAVLLAADAAHALASTAAAAIAIVSGSEDAHRDLEQKLTKLLGEDNLVGSSGEFGLLFAFLTNSPRSATVDGELAVSLEDVRSMFVDTRLPDGWDRWPKSRRDWIVHTLGLTRSAFTAFRHL